MHQASDELKRLMRIEITDNDRMIIFLNSLSDINEHMNVNQMKEQLKQFGVAAEIFEEALVPFVPKIMANFAKRIKEEGSARLHVSISEAVGQLVWFILDKVQDPIEQAEIFENQIMKVPLSMVDKSNNKIV